jgi:hypothetical protein
MKRNERKEKRQKQKFFYFLGFYFQVWVSTFFSVEEKKMGRWMESLLNHTKHTNYSLE